MKYVPVVLCVLLSTGLFAECTRDYRSDKKNGVVVQNVILEGTRTLTSTEVAQMEAILAGACFDDSGDEIADLLGLAFRDSGYFMAEIESVRIKVVDPLSMPKQVEVRVKAAEGPLCTLAEIKFEGNHVFGAETLRAQLPLKKGDSFGMQKIRSGLDNIRKLYVAEGYLDFTPIPDTVTPSSDANVSLTVIVEEGKQYRMGKLEIVGRDELAGQLYANWTLAEGAPFDLDYLSKYIEENQHLLPPGFNQRSSTRILRECRDHNVTVQLFLDESKQVPSPKQPETCTDNEENKSN